MQRSGHEIELVAAADCAARRHIVQHAGHVSVQQREELLHQRPATIWLTGLSGAGKSTLAYEMERRLHAQGRLSYVLDGDNLRHGLNRDLGFAPEQRRENIRRVAEVASLMNQAGLIVFTALISPRREDRALARSIIGEAGFLEVYVSTGLEVCEARDPKGLYGKARAGLIPEFTGVSAPYEAPHDPALCIDMSRHSIEASADRLMVFLSHRCLVQG
jgi:adenylylsulfate kinase